MGAVSLVYSLLLLLQGPRGAVGLGDGGEAWGEGWEEMGRQEKFEEGEVERQDRQGRRLGEAEGIAAYNRVDTPFAGKHSLKRKGIHSDLKPMLDSAVSQNL